MIPWSLALPLLFRSLSLLLPQTFFQPDEYYQALEPAHHLIFGYGYLSWEWRDLPGSGSGTLWEEIVVRGRMRGWIWPGVYSLMYKFLQYTGLDKTTYSIDLSIWAGLMVIAVTGYRLDMILRRYLPRIIRQFLAVAMLSLVSTLASISLESSDFRGFSLLTLLPRLVGVTVAALTDYFTYRLSLKLIGEGAGAGALFLSLSSLFNAHLLPRSLSTSPETLLVTIALVYFPLPALGVSDWTAGNYVTMDRHQTKSTSSSSVNGSLALATISATLAICIRPTTAPLWAYLGSDLLVRTARQRGYLPCLRILLIACLASLAVIAGSTSVDYHITGRIMLPTVTFIHQNILKNISSFYGKTNPFYHLTQSLPIMLFPIWYWWVKGFISCLLPLKYLSTGLASLDRPEGLPILARAIVFAIAMLSLSPHSEWRFLHPFLPALLLFALPPIFHTYRATVLDCTRFSNSIRQYVRFGRLPFYLCMISPIIPFLYLNIFHGRAQVQVMDTLREWPEGNVTGVVALMPCHSTPWQSHLHKDIPAWSLTCEPPLNMTAFDHVTQQDMFYSAPVSYLERVFPYPPVPLHDVTQIRPVSNLPSHVILFGSLLEEVGELASGEERNVKYALRKLGYREIWKRWNGFDWAQDEDLRRGGVRIWQKMLSSERELESGG